MILKRNWGNVSLHPGWPGEGCVLLNQNQPDSCVSVQNCPGEGCVSLHHISWEKAVYLFIKAGQERWCVAPSQPAGRWQCVSLHLKRPGESSISLHQNRQGKGCDLLLQNRPGKGCVSLCKNWPGEGCVWVHENGPGECTLLLHPGWTGEGCVLHFKNWTVDGGIPLHPSG